MSNTVANIKKYQHENNFIEKNITTKTILDLICYIDKESSTAKSQKLTAKSQWLKIYGGLDYKHDSLLRAE